MFASGPMVNDSFRVFGKGAGRKDLPEKLN